MRTTFWFAINMLLAILATAVKEEVILGGVIGFLTIMASLFGLAFSIAQDLKEIFG